MESPQSEHWQKAIESEMSSLKEHGVWDFCATTKRQEGCWKSMGIQNKMTTMGTLPNAKHTSCLSRIIQEEGIDDTETFAPVIRYESVRFLLALAAQLNVIFTKWTWILLFRMVNLMKKFTVVRRQTLGNPCIQGVPWLADLQVAEMHGHGM
jgi:hypothetical protein